MRRPTEAQLIDFLRAVDADFPVPLSEKTALSDYAGKLAAHAVLCAEFDGETLCALAAGYTERLPEHGMAYIALAATRKAYRRRGCARRLVREFLRICAERGIPAVHLYTKSPAAFALYLELGFVPYAPPDERRPGDGHLICRFEEGAK